jgi:hypothetical protein
MAALGEIQRLLCVSFLAAEGSAFEGFFSFGKHETLKDPRLDALWRRVGLIGWTCCAPGRSGAFLRLSRFSSAEKHPRMRLCGSISIKLDLG